MKRIHLLAVALLLGVAAVFGVAAAIRTTGVGMRARAHSSNALVAARTAQLDRFERALRRSLRDRPPALPPVPSVRSLAARPTPRIVFRRPAPILIIRHSLHHDDGGHDSESGRDD